MVGYKPVTSLNASSLSLSSLLASNCPLAPTEPIATAVELSIMGRHIGPPQRFPVVTVLVEGVAVSRPLRTMRPSSAQFTGPALQKKRCDVVVEPAAGGSVVPGVVSTAFESLRRTTTPAGECVAPSVRNDPVNVGPAPI